LGKVKILPGLFLLLALFLGFLYLNSPFEDIQELAQLNLFFVVAGALMFIIFLKAPDLAKIQLESASEFFDEYSTGLVLGVVAAGLTASLAIGLDRIINFTGSITAASIAQMSDTTIFFVVQVLPFLETMILVGVTLVFGSFLKGKIPYNYLIAAVVASAFFAAFHFAAVSGGDYEYSIQGFYEFVTSIDGALVHFSFGLISAVIFLGYRSFVIPYSLHAMNNLMATAGIIGWTPFLTTILVINIGIVVLTLSKIQLKRWQQFSVSRVMT